MYRGLTEKGNKKSHEELAVAIESELGKPVKSEALKEKMTKKMKKKREAPVEGETKPKRLEDQMRANKVEVARVVRYDGWF